MAREGKKPLWKRWWVWLAVVIVIGAIAAGPSSDDGDAEAAQSSPEESQDTADILEAADAAYENENYDEALELYTQVTEEDDAGEGVAWYRYAYLKKENGEFDAEAYMRAYKFLQEQEPEHRYVGYARDSLTNNAVELDYRQGLFEDYEEGVFVHFTGRITDKGDDYLLVGTDRSVAYYGDYVYVNRDSSEELRAIKDDVVSIWGPYRGAKDYAGLLMQSEEAPSVDLEFVEVVSEGL